MIPLEGEALFAAPPAEVFPRLLDPAVLKRCIPGCESLEDRGGGRYEAVLKLGVGAVKGTFKAAIALADLDPPRGFSLGVDAKSLVGSGSGSVRVTLAPEGAGTRLRYAGELRATGVIAAVGQRLLGAGARNTADGFFAGLAREVGSG